jgi:hypothetical protein
MKNQRILRRKKQVKLNKKRVERNKKRNKIKKYDFLEKTMENSTKKKRQLKSNKYNVQPAQVPSAQPVLKHSS